MRQSILILACGLMLAGCAWLNSEPATDQPPPLVVARDIAYTSTQDLDVFAPEDASGLPVVILLHGLGGRREQYEDGARALAEMDTVVYNINWRSVPWEYGELALMEDVACAVRYAFASAEAYGGDPSRITIFGHSIGGWSGAVVTLAGGQFDGDCVVLGRHARVHGFVGYAGAYDAGESNPDGGAPHLRQEDPDLWEAIDPFGLIGGNREARFHLVVGDRDQPFLQVAQRYHAALLEAGYEVSLTMFEGRAHDLSPPDPMFDRLISIIRETAE